ncbi:glycoside hydrolase family 18 protein [Diplodia corticola]|uniref:chitinase n=1 Tax=Diplodia corticola TaxID=236234 RepID=A0A1J9S179_9PEZI|nr:glycoside hydrolase family 18 protein [Diplodia corticola]OJD33421.1 glycoside hydrolase family 18 protein [Diplodia corticola]
MNVRAAGGNAALLSRQVGSNNPCTDDIICPDGACCGPADNTTQLRECGFGKYDCVPLAPLTTLHARGLCVGLVAASGRNAEDSKKLCALGVCCSRFGFCSRDPDHCDVDKGCQSNCSLSAPPPQEKSVASARSRVIGYYSAASSSRKCRPFPPRAIPVNGLTHVNFAFASVNHSSLEISQPAAGTPDDPFLQVADIRSQQSEGSNLRVFAAIAGSIILDNGTIGNIFQLIAEDKKKSETFSHNLLKFLNQYGFDGVDLDWEYPGIPDPFTAWDSPDTEGFVNLLRIVHDTFATEPKRQLGISFTIPTSYWYLKNFDIRHMMEYADWVNVMAFDLHGVWDSHNPLGNIVRPHTNLTEIKLSLELLWLNGVPAEKVNLGLGLYGRSFLLHDPACGRPGCRFDGGANPGPCTTSSGTLAYFEIMDLINQQHPQIIHDEAAAIKWAQYGQNDEEWVSFDDSDTLNAKVEWANSTGLGGVMIWSIDQDDDSFSALTAVVGGDMDSFQERLVKPSSDEALQRARLTAQGCKVSDCAGEGESSPPVGYALAPNGGGFPDRCTNGEKKYIFCPVDAITRVPPAHICTWKPHDLWVHHT